MKENKLILFSYSIILFIVVWVSANMNWGDGRWNNIVKNDGNGYYAYLPAIFIYQDLTFNFIDGIVDDSLSSNINKDFVTKLNGTIFNKYYIGTSIALIPFFALGHISNWLYGIPLDGYSVYYRIFTQVGAIFYLFVGLILFVKIFRFYDISKKVISISLFAVVFGTNIFYYVVSEPSMSHIYSFAFVNLFVYCVIKFFRSHKNKYFFIGVFTLAIITLIRPVNILVIFSVPFLAGSSKILYSGLKYLVGNWKIIITGLLIYIILLSVQIILYKIQTGKFIIYSYTNEGFSFLDPNLVKFLFSYRKGLFVYTPILFIALFGIIYIKNKYKVIALLLFLFLVIYILSSWWMWYYGGGFSQRAMIEYYIYFFIPFSILLQNFKFPKTVTALVIILIFVCQIQTYQYQRGYIHWSDMNKRLYWDNFLRIDKVIKKDAKEWE